MSVEERFYGKVVADSPQAARAGREILAQGGTAADAAVAMYFVMAVTLPSQASLGGGGVCLGFDPSSREPEAIEFLAVAPAAVPASADRPNAIPGNVRGFYALHGRWGRLRWSQVLAPAENLARFGFVVSRALSTDINQVERALEAEPAIYRVFAAPGGPGLAREGDTVTQNDLASTIARIRTAGAADFYTGVVADRLIEGARQAGGWLDRAQLADYQPSWRKPLLVGFDYLRAYFPPPPPAGGVLAGQMWSMLTSDDRYESSGRPQRAAMLVDDATRAFADHASSGNRAQDPQEMLSSAHINALLQGSVPANRGAMAENPAAATLVAVDRGGGAVACAVSMNSLFGTGRIAPGTGVVLASMPGPGGRGADMLGPMMVIKPSGRQFVFAGAASGGVAGPTSLVGVAARALLAERPLPDALAAPRVHGDSDPAVAYAEPGVDASDLAALAAGRKVVSTPSLGRVNAILCRDGLPDDPDSCAAGTDPRGFGLSVDAE